MTFTVMLVVALASGFGYFLFIWGMGLSIHKFGDVVGKEPRKKVTKTSIYFDSFGFCKWH